MTSLISNSEIVDEVTLIRLSSSASCCKANSGDHPLTVNLHLVYEMPHASAPNGIAAVGKGPIRIEVTDSL